MQVKEVSTHKSGLSYINFYINLSHRNISHGKHFSNGVPISIKTEQQAKDSEVIRWGDHKVYPGVLTQYERQGTCTHNLANSR